MRIGIVAPLVSAISEPQRGGSQAFVSDLARGLVARGHDLLLAYAEEVGQAHVRARFQAGDGSAIGAIAFRAVGQKLGQALLTNRGRAVHALGSLSLDRWQGEERMQLRLIDVASAEPVDRLRG